MPNLAQAIRTLKERNIFVYCADPGRRPARKDRSAGGRRPGAGQRGPAAPPPLTRKLCDASVTLEMAAPDCGVDSYNVSVAAGILLYHIMQRRKGG